MPSDRAVQYSDTLNNAAIAASTTLTKLGKAHAIIGGQALRLLGAGRLTQDVDIIVAEPPLPLRAAMIEIDARFSIDQTNRMFFDSGNNMRVPVEMLQGGPGLSLALPSAMNARTLSVSGGLILHPAMLIITKVKRWMHIADSTRPASQVKAASDAEDIVFLLGWLADRGTKVDFDAYASVKPKDQLLPGFKKLYTSLKPNDRALLEAVLEPTDFSFVSS